MGRGDGQDFSEQLPRVDNQLAQLQHIELYDAESFAKTNSEYFGQEPLFDRLLEAALLCNEGMRHPLQLQLNERGQRLYQHALACSGYSSQTAQLSAGERDAIEDLTLRLGQRYFRSIDFHLLLT